jgi:hypothetical protein
MTKTKDSTFFENKLLDFIAEPDPLFSMMQWITEQLMEIEVSKKANAKKGFIVQNGRPIGAVLGFAGLIPDWELCIF